MNQIGTITFHLQKQSCWSFSLAAQPNRPLLIKHTAPTCFIQKTPATSEGGRLCRYASFARASWNRPPMNVKSVAGHSQPPLPQPRATQPKPSPNAASTAANSFLPTRAFVAAADKDSIY